MTDVARSVADDFLGVLVERDVDYVFGNAGTDFGPVIDAAARRRAAGEPVPTPVPVTHEVTLMAMAHGYGMVSGRVPTVMLHTIAGTANALGGIINAARVRQPILVAAGRTPLTDGATLGSRDMHIHWAQESFDQGSMAREWTKWDYELREGNPVEAVLDRAMAIAESDPPGPVYLTLPREVLAGSSAGSAGVGAAGSGPPSQTPSAVGPDSAAVGRAAEAIAGARNPIVITRSAGRSPAGAEELARLVEALGAPVFDPHPTHANLAFDHPLRVGGPPARFLAEAAVIVVVDSDVPWTPKRSRPAADATVIALGPDVLHAGYPMWNFPVHIGLAGRVEVALAELWGRLDLGDGRDVADRRLRWERVAAGERAAAAARADEGAGATPLDKAYFTRELDRALPDDAIVVDELGCDASQLTIGPGCYFGHPQAGVLGWGAGAALGAKLAAPERPVVCVVGDGSYMFGVPTTVHWAARRYDVPVMFAVWNNARWGAVERATRMVYPEGHAARHDDFAFSDIGPPIDFEAVCEAAGGVGLCVEGPEDLPAALARGFAELAAGRQVLLNLIAH